MLRTEDLAPDMRRIHLGGDDFAAAAQTVLPAPGGDVFVWAAAESGSLLPLRRHLRALGHDRRSMDPRGYWKIGEAEHREDPDAPEAASEPSSARTALATDSVVRA